MLLSSLVAGFILLFLIIIALVVLIFIFWIRMLIDCVKRKFKKENEKIAWVVVIAILGFVGALIYYFVVKINDKKEIKKKK